ncbi:MAG: hypothetical protein EAX90_12455 [Candidatus Heimdallarchaeota archaeon]|nr:hypothetical protein [Candidatus Heimdallarchaeota archaeon]
MAVPLGAVITEGIVLVVVTFVVIMLYIRYANRKKDAALALAVAFTFWDIAIISLFVNRILSYLIEQEIIEPILYQGEIIVFSELGINLGYAFSALSNIFITLFVALVFTQSPMFRRTRMLIPINIAGLNGITIGLLIGATMRGWPEPSYDLIPTLYHLLMTIISFCMLIIFTVRPYRQSTLRWERAGFAFIISSGVFGILIYLSFAIDFLLGDGGLNVFEKGYTPFFYLAYVFAVIMCSFAYLGYVMPNYVRNWFKEKDSIN